MVRTEDEVRGELRASVMRFAQGATAKDADEVLDVIVQGWGFRDCTQLAGVLPLLTVPGRVGANGALFFLHSFVLIGNESTAGRKMSM